LSVADAPAPAAAGGTPAPRPARPRLLLAVCCIAQFLVILDLSIVNIALPEMQADLAIAAGDLQWVIDAYAILFAGFLMLAGRATDVLGQRRTFVLALAVFTVASTACGLAPDDLSLILARGLQGLAGAGMAAASLAIITSSFAPGAERARAIALWGAMNGLGGATGMLLGGVLTEYLSWRWVFLVNVPVAIAAIAMAVAVVHERRARQRRSFDLAGALVLTIGLLVSAYGGVTAGTHGFGSAAALVPLIGGSLILMLFGPIEKRAKAPLVPPGAISKGLRSVNAIVALFSAALFPMWFVGSLYMQQVLALSPLETGLAFLPMALVIFAVAQQAGKLVARAGVRPVLGSGLLLMTTGLALFSLIEPSGSTLQYVILPGVLTAAGIGLAVVSSTIAATALATNAQEAGLASGLVNTARQVGGGLGLAILISVGTQFTAGRIGGGAQVEPALTDGFALAYLIGAGLTLTAAILTFVLLPGAAEAPKARAGRRIVGAAAAVLLVFAAVGVAIPRSQGEPIGAYTLEGTMRFATEPDLHPPQMEVQIDEGRRLPGLIMAANFYDLTKGPMVGQSGPMILGQDLQPVWFEPVPEDVVAANLTAQTWNGRPVLTYWQGEITETGEVATGTIRVLDESYRELARIEGQDGWVLTLHEFDIRGDEAWVTATKNTERDLTRYGGVNNGVFVDSAVQRYSLRTGKLLSTWKASDHIELAESETQPPPNGFPWDATHVNAIDVSDDGRKMLVSMRNTMAGYYVDVATGRIEWRVGGKRSDFRMGDGAAFEWQHDMELQPGGRLTMFDNHCCEITGAGEYLQADAPSRALTLQLDFDARSARLVDEIGHGGNFFAQYMGNEQELPGGRRWVSWGQVPYFSMYSPDGELEYDATLPTPNMSYRSYVQPWTGRPGWPPKCVAQGGTVAASWNGATEVRRWRVRDGRRILATEARDGFETRIAAPGARAGLTVEALDAGGDVLGTCRTR
jgi:EmrB/QacA subfamily drug resistance transporter